MKEIKKRIQIVHTTAVKDRTILFGIRNVDTPQKASLLAHEFLDSADREHLLVCCVDSKCHPVSLEIVAIGTVNSCLVSARDIFKNAILSNAAFILVFHNHLSGDPTPSRDDIKVTEKLIAAGKLIGIPLLDHIIVGEEDKYQSIRETMGWTADERTSYCLGE